jgi:hypothetical protein
MGLDDSGERCGPWVSYFVMLLHWIDIFLQSGLSVLDCLWLRFLSCYFFVYWWTFYITCQTEGFSCFSPSLRSVRKTSTIARGHHREPRLIGLDEINVYVTIPINGVPSWLNGIIMIMISILCNRFTELNWTVSPWNKPGQCHFW